MALKEYILIVKMRLQHEHIPRILHSIYVGFYFHNHNHKGVNMELKHVYKRINGVELGMSEECELAHILDVSEKIHEEMRIKEYVQRIQWAKKKGVKNVN